METCIVAVQEYEIMQSIGEPCDPNQLNQSLLRDLIFVHPSIDCTACVRTAVTAAVLRV